MSGTPRTDAELQVVVVGDDYSGMVEFARQLERELYAALDLNDVNNTTHVTNTLQLVRQAIFHVLDEPKPKSGLTWDFDDDEDRVDFADAVVAWITSNL